MKFIDDEKARVCRRRSREGAWIEIKQSFTTIASSAVAPVRERGLKFNSQRSKKIITSVAPVRERGLK